MTSFRERFKWVAPLGGACMLLAVSACFENPSEPHVDGGGSSETTNGLVTGRVLKANGSPAASISVSLRPRNFVADTLAVTAKAASGQDAVLNLKTDAQGYFRIDSLQPGGYYVEAYDGLGAATLFECGVGPGDTVKLTERALAPTGAISGHLQADFKTTGSVFVQVLGMQRIARVNPADGGFIINHLPAGYYTLRALASNAAIEPHFVTDAEAKAGDTLDVGTIALASFENEDYTAWPHAQVLRLNTTASGADIPSPLGSFPLLVRLTRAQLDFTKSKGNDLRFADAAGKHLRYAIDHWDSAAGEASVWVRLESLPAQQSRSAITLYWGRENAPSWSLPHAVFDSADGHGGVWHLEEQAPDTTTDRLYRDASPTESHGDDRTLSALKDGIVGLGQGIQPGDYVRIRAGNGLRPKRTLTLSLWFKTSGVPGDGGDLISMGDNYGVRIGDTGYAEFFLYKGQGREWARAVTQGIHLNDSTWHHMAATYDGEIMRLYVDGKQRATTPYALDIAYQLGSELYLGRHATGKRNYDFRGSLDEVQIHPVARSAAYIKALFESQRRNATLIEFEPPLR